MNIRTLSLVLGAAVTVAAGGLAATACSSNNNSTGGNSTNDASSNNDTGSSSGGNNDSGGTGDDSSPGTGDAGSGADCGSTPHLHAGDGGTIYCPFGPDGSAIDCPTATTYCCIGGEISKGNYAVSQCQAIGQACNNPPPDGGKYPGRPVQCEEATDCQGGEAGASSVCCATGGTPAQDPACGYYRESPAFTATTCVSGTTCPAGDVQICSTNVECGTGHTCQPFKALGLGLGFCQ